ncbi:ABC transporter permease [Streptobacillus moniliformis]|uniref:Binding-protein-dependent transport systems inner membrane component n=1 Tax=Streptobacillus moniliformis (strain ATCC 14647 / DSM 12112 / NCTC 10651 / 9901) TaxID=519441 RepID=D1AYN1_STRM9|nr:ABC transporter permease [Streptobacillus moniliformis]ACZ01407.1 binding-protein-dependent transport systems inner membrane component [Streptobacillus moniliformis DSM 12112]AVL43581.1 ABC transporter permease [Streptobacillus moniliformis]SQA13433.1 Glutathione transport system permease protein gsiD [Streptobacillus moniliformis]
MKTNKNSEKDDLMKDIDNLASEVPSGFNVIKREFQKDKVALFSLTFLSILIIVIFFSASFLLDVEDVMKVRLLDKYAAPLEGYWLGADYGGRSILGQLIIGARNSIIIGFSVTIITSFVGIVVGVIISYYGGWIENISMRIIDFISILPTTLIIIVFVTIVPKYNVITFILIMSIFYWTGTARLIRGKVLSEVRRDYINASKTMGTSDLKIIFRELLPNISSLIIVGLTLGFASNLGIETGLTFLGYGLPPQVPSLGILISYATAPEVLADKWWVWMPASMLILIIMLCINYIGEALKRASDARQRLG